MLGQFQDGITKVDLGPPPIERHALAGPFLERLAIGGDGLLELGGAVLAHAQRIERVAKTGLRFRPIKRHTLAGLFLERPAKGGQGSLELDCAALTLA